MENGLNYNWFGAKKTWQTLEAHKLSELNECRRSWMKTTNSTEYRIYHLLMFWSRKPARESYWYVWPLKWSVYECERVKHLFWCIKTIILMLDRCTWDSGGIRGFSECSAGLWRARSHLCLFDELLKPFIFKFKFINNCLL